MEGIAKSAEVAQPEEFKHQISNEVLPTRPDSNQYVLKYFGINPNSVPNKKEIQTITEWAYGDGSPAGKGLMKIKDLESKLGYSGDGDRINKLFNYISVLKSIEHTKDLMNDEIKSAKGKIIKEEDMVKEFTDKAIREHENKLKEARANLDRARSRHRIELTTQTKNIRDKYKAQLDDLETMAKAYKARK